MRRSRPSTDRASGSRIAPAPQRVASEDAGSASLEFLTVGMILLVPLVYLVLAMSSIQAAALGVEGAARQAARAAVLHAGGQVVASVDRTVRVVLGDYGVDADAASVRVDCSSACDAPGARVTVAVRAAVALPLVPSALAASGIGTVSVDASATQTVSRFGNAS